MNEELYEIAKQLDTYVKTLVNKRCDGEVVFQDRLYDLITALEWHIDEAKQLHKEMQSEGLTINTIEAEGALRMALRIESELQEYRELFNQKESRI